MVVYKGDYPSNIQYCTTVHRRKSPLLKLTFMGTTARVFVTLCPVEIDFLNGKPHIHCSLSMSIEKKWPNNVDDNDICDPLIMQKCILKSIQNCVPSLRCNFPCRSITDLSRPRVPHTNKTTRWEGRKTGVLWKFGRTEDTLGGVGWSRPGRKNAI